MSAKPASRIRRATRLCEAHRRCPATAQANLPYPLRQGVAAAGTAIALLPDLAYSSGPPGLPSYGSATVLTAPTRELDGPGCTRNPKRLHVCTAAILHVVCSTGTMSMHVITLLAQKGGAGKTNLAIAVEASSAGRTVVVLTQVLTQRWGDSEDASS